MDRIPVFATSKDSDKGFSLIELSIVLIIIGILVAGISGGANLIKSAKFRAISTDVRDYRIAVNSFKLRYDALPGDISNATSYFSGVTNGDGNGYIGNDKVTGSENYYAFKHLQEAGIFSSDLSGSGSGGTQIGVNVPESSYSSDTTYYFSNDSFWGVYSPKGNYVTLSGAGGEGWNDYQVNIIDAFDIDTKFDDGKPYTGQMITWSNNSGECVASGQRFADSPTVASVSYKTSDTTDVCTVVFALDGYIFK